MSNFFKKFFYIEHLLLYECETEQGSSGSPILKATKDGLRIVGLHRGGCEDYNYGSILCEIIKVFLCNRWDKQRQSK